MGAGAGVGMARGMAGWVVVWVVEDLARINAGSREVSAMTR